MRSLLRQQFNKISSGVRQMSGDHGHKHYAWDQQPMNKGKAFFGVFGVFGAGTGITLYSAVKHQHDNGRAFFGGAYKK